MDLFSLSHVGALLGVDPKTLRLWLHEAGLTALPHPDDARQKCLNLSQIQHIANTHGRHLPPAFTASAPPPPALPPPDVLSQLAQMQLQIFTRPRASHSPLSSASPGLTHAPVSPGSSSCGQRFFSRRPSPRPGCSSSPPPPLSRCSHDCLHRR